MNAKITDLLDKAADMLANLSCAAEDNNLTDAHRQAVELSSVTGKIRTLLWEDVNKKKDREEPWP